MSNKFRIPSYRRHKATGKAVVTLNGRDIYLGRFNSAESQQAYRQLIAEYTAGHGLVQQPTTNLAIAELLVAFLRYAKAVHTKKEQQHFSYAMKPLRDLYARTPVEAFGPLKLKAVRQQLVEDGLARQTVNKRINRIRHIFKWGVENELVPANVLHGLQAVAGLRFGRTEAKETGPVKPVPDAFVQATMQHVSPVVADMIELQSITGMRGGEMVVMRGCDLDTSGKVWVYTPASHKTAYRGHQRKIYLGPKAQAIVKPYLKPDLTAALFSPADSERMRRQAQHATRLTPLSCGNRPGTNCKNKPRKRPGDAYTAESYRRAVTYGIQRANKALLKAAAAEGIPADKVALVPHWHPHQLRHNAATHLRREFGIEVARIILGHRSPAITEVYAEVDHARAIEVMGRIG